MRGTMLWFNNDKDFGYITAEDGNRVAVRGSGFAGGVAPTGRCGGTEVTFEVSNGDGAPMAQNVALVPEASPRRARRRHGHR